MPDETPKASATIHYVPVEDPDLTSECEIKEQQREIKAESGPVIHRIPLTAIGLDSELYPPSQRRQPTTKRQLELLCQGQKLSPVKVMKDQSAAAHVGKRYLLVDGYATWRALQRRTRLCKNGKWPFHLSQKERNDLDLVEVEIVAAPVLSRTSRGLKAAIRSLYEKFPGYPESRAAKELRCDIKTIRKYAADLVDQWEKLRDKMIDELSAKGKSSREIAQTLKLKWPWARGLSQPAITRKVGKPLRS